MISIVTSTYKPQNLENLIKNISETIDVEYEIIEIHNPGIMGICEAYNLGALKSKYDSLLFIHDDIEFRTKNWGSLLIKHLEDFNTGVLGLAGSNYVPSAPSGWYIEKEIPEKQNNKTLAIALDGVFLCCSKEKFHTVKFNELDVKGFHGYDYDFSLRMSKHYQNYIIHDILIEHFSSGNPNKTYLDNNILIRQNLGSDFGLPKNSRKEMIAFLRFIESYFKYYPFNINQFAFTLKFFLFFKMNLSDTIIIMKKYAQIFKHRKAIILKDA